MRWLTQIGALSLTLVAAGCLGMQGDPGTGGTGVDGGNTGGNGTATPPTARQLFDQNVAPLLGACSSCHAGAGDPGAPAFLGANAAAYYSSLTSNARFVNNDPTKSVLVTHKHSGTGVDLTTAQLKYVTDWLQQENVEHVLPPPPTAAASTATTELAKFAKCMVQADYNTAGMNDVQNQDTIGAAGPCYSCHSTGLYVYLSKDATQNFTMLQTQPSLSKFVDAEYNADGTFKDIVQTYRIRDRGTAPGHPQYVLSSARTSALDTFFTSTYTKYKAGNCP
jgi:hypothetical protein